MIWSYFEAADLTCDRIFFQKRVERIRNLEAVKRNQERLKSPTTFPSVPLGGLGQP